MKKKAFTSLELILAVSIIGLISAIVFPKFTGIKDSAKVANVQQSLSNMRTAFDLYYTSTDEFPREAHLIRCNNGDGPDLTEVAPCSGDKSHNLGDFFLKSRLSKTPSFYSKNTVEVYELATVIPVKDKHRTGDSLFPDSPDSGIGGWIYREDDGAIRAFLPRGVYNDHSINWSIF